jgi:8-amino-7-oxononanoate synthase
MKTEDNIRYYIQQRKDKELFRQLSVSQCNIDFSSNDYLGLSRSAFIRQQVEIAYHHLNFQKSGATGSRLLSGNSELCERLESMLAKHHHAEAALLFNAGFDANVGLISTVVQPNDIVFYDELVHASIHQGMRLSKADLVSFKHNDYIDLENKLKASNQAKNVFIITESIFSMEGDRADLKKLADLSQKYDAHLIIDEAHATGIFGSYGSGLCNEAGIEEQCFARVYTFGKAIGSHGAVVVGKKWLKEYLINFSKNFIYTTALDTHNLLNVEHSYLFLKNNINQLVKLNNLKQYFIDRLSTLKNAFKVTGEGPIFGIIVQGNEKCRKIATYLQQNGLDVRPILSPTVPEGQERLRIILHSFNTAAEIDLLFSLLIDYK